MDKGGFVYILANRRNGALYAGVTADLVRRMSEHRQGLIPGFTREHGIKRLVWQQLFGEITLAITREKQIKKWNRQWKIDLIQVENPHWLDLAVSMLGFPPLPPDVLPPDETGDGSPRSRG